MEIYGSNERAVDIVPEMDIVFVPPGYMSRPHQPVYMTPSQGQEASGSTMVSQSPPWEHTYHRLRRASAQMYVFLEILQ